MKAVVKTAPGEANVELLERDAPRPGAAEVLIEVKAAGVCGSDLHIYHWDTKYAIRTPVTMGHEMSGIVAEVGPSVTDWKPGDRVTVEPCLHTCGTCRYCRIGALNLCAERKVMGYWFDGAFAGHVVAPAQKVHRLPPEVEFDEGALAEPLACSVHAVCGLTHVDMGDLVAVTGPGPIGLLCALLSKAAGARVMLVGRTKDLGRLRLAAGLGVDYCVNSETDDAVKLARELGHVHGADVVFECSGAPEAAGLGLEIVRKQGAYTQIGLFGGNVIVDLGAVAYKELRFTGSIAQKWGDWERTMELMRKRTIDLRAMVTDILPMSQWSEAFARAESQRGLKILLDPSR